MALTPVIWLLGLSGTGKTTLASLLRLYLEGQDYSVNFIDADRFRKQHGFHGFSPADRMQNISAIRETALESQAQGDIVIVAAITPYACMRDLNRELIPLYREVWVRCSLHTLFERETKGFYARAISGEMDNLTGINATFDVPTHADLIIDTDQEDLVTSYVQLRDLAERAIRDSNSLSDYLHNFNDLYSTQALSANF
ncbi:MAG: adenylyl-sulfate kinase [Desulfovibrionaceae bacterium]|nr:adenylyl-sulfate kinase [Desulfovibrionaceae bacterium]